MVPNFLSRDTLAADLGLLRYPLTNGQQALQINCYGQSLSMQHPARPCTC